MLLWVFHENVVPVFGFFSEKFTYEQNDYKFFACSDSPYGLVYVGF